MLVAFVHGDMRLPIVLGGLYNGQDKPPSDRQKDKDQKMVRTKAGHELLFDDSSQQRARQGRDGGRPRARPGRQGPQGSSRRAAGTRWSSTTRAARSRSRRRGGQSVVLDGNSGQVTVTGATVGARRVERPAGRRHRERQGRRHGRGPDARTGRAVPAPLQHPHPHSSASAPTTPPVQAPRLHAGDRRLGHREGHEVRWRWRSSSDAAGASRSCPTRRARWAGARARRTSSSRSRSSCSPRSASA